MTGSRWARKRVSWDAWQGATASWNDYEDRHQTMSLCSFTSPNSPPYAPRAPCPPRRAEPPPNLRPSPRASTRRACVPHPAGASVRPRPSPQEPPPCTRRPRPARASHTTRGSPPTTTDAAAGTGSRRCAGQTLALRVLGGATALLEPALVLGGAELRGQLALELLLLDGLEVARGAVPVAVEDEALVVLRLREDARPGIEQGGGVGDGLGDALWGGGRVRALALGDDLS